MIRLRKILAQAAAEALDAGAGFRQRLGRGRVGDAEVRGQAKGLALHRRDADAFQQRVVGETLEVRRPEQDGEAGPDLCVFLV